MSPNRFILSPSFQECVLDILEYNDDKEDFTSFYVCFENVVDKHASLKTVKMRGNNAPFITQQCRIDRN